MAVDWGDVPKGCIDRGQVRRVLGYFKPYKRLAVPAVVLIAAEAALGLVPAVVLKGIIDSLTQRSSGLGHVAVLVGAGVAAALAGGLVGVGLTYLESSISRSIMTDLRNQLFERLLGQSVGFFTANRSGEVLSRLTNDVRGIDNVVTDTLFGVVSNLLVGLTTLVLMFVLDWRLTLFSLLIIPVVAGPTRRVGRATQRARQRTQAKLAELTISSQEVLGISGILLVKAFGAQLRERVRFRRINEELRNLEVREAMIGRWFGMLMHVLEVAGPGLFWLFGGWLVLTGRASVGTVVTFVAVLTMRLYGAVTSLSTMHVNVIGSLALFQRLFEYLDLQPEIAEASDARSLDDVAGAVSFEDITFRYRPDARPALDEVSFEVAPGQLVALVGPSGAGKTTATYLLSRFYDPQRGRVLIDGTDVRRLSLESLSRHIGLVFQDPFLFHATVRENLLYAKPDASDGEIEAATKAAYIHDVIVSLPEGYDTVVGERGLRLSGGEKQRLAIARMILKNPPILVLDEATSHLDTVSERLIQAALRPLLKGRTALVIAHRLSTILAADLILVFDRGRIVERGRHSDLVNNGGVYSALWQKQFLGDARDRPFTAAP